MKSKPQARDGSRTRTCASTRKDAATTPAEALSRKGFEKELKNLHIELVRLQEWVQHAGLKVCIVFEGRDSACAPQIFDLGRTDAVAGSSASCGMIMT